MTLGRKYPERHPATSTGPSNRTHTSSRFQRPRYNSGQPPSRLGAPRKEGFSFHASLSPETCAARRCEIMVMSDRQLARRVASWSLGRHQLHPLVSPSMPLLKATKPIPGPPLALLPLTTHTPSLPLSLSLSLSLSQHLLPCEYLSRDPKSLRSTPPRLRTYA